MIVAFLLSLAYINAIPVPGIYSDEDMCERLSTPEKWVSRFQHGTVKNFAADVCSSKKKYVHQASANAEPFSKDQYETYLSDRLEAVVKDVTTKSIVVMLENNSDQELHIEDGKDDAHKFNWIRFPRDVPPGHAIVFGGQSAREQWFKEAGTYLMFSYRIGTHNPQEYLNVFVDTRDPLDFTYWVKISGKKYTLKEMLNHRHRPTVPIYGDNDRMKSRQVRHLSDRFDSFQVDAAMAPRNTDLKSQDAGHFRLGISFQGSYPAQVEEFQTNQDFEVQANGRIDEANNKLDALHLGFQKASEEIARLAAHSDEAQRKRQELMDSWSNRARDFRRRNMVKSRITGRSSKSSSDSATDDDEAPGPSSETFVHVSDSGSDSEPVVSQRPRRKPQSQSPPPVEELIPVSDSEADSENEDNDETADPIPEASGRGEETAEENEPIPEASEHGEGSADENEPVATAQIPSAKDKGKGKAPATGFPKMTLLQANALLQNEDATINEIIAAFGEPDMSQPGVMTYRIEGTDQELNIHYWRDEDDGTTMIQDMSLADYYISE